MTTTTRPLVLNVTEAGNLLGVSRSTAYELVRSGELESVQLRRRVVVPVAAIAERLGISVPDVWLAFGREGDVAPVEAEMEDRCAGALDLWPQGRWGACRRCEEVAQRTRSELTALACCQEPADRS